MDATEKCTEVFRGLHGRDRFAIYAVALGTGFRAEELAALRPESFDLDANPPTVTVGAGYTKNREPVVQPIAPTLAMFLRVYLVGRPSGGPVWLGSWSQRSAGDG